MSSESYGQSIVAQPRVSPARCRMSALGGDGVWRRALRLLVVTSWLTVLVTAGGLAGAPPALATVIDNGTIQIGINDAAHLIELGGVGLRFLLSTASDKESLAHGCSCEGWGVSGTFDDIDSGTVSFSGYAQVHNGPSPAAVGVVGLTVQTPVVTGEGTQGNSNGRELKSVVTTSNGKLEITHEFRPSAATPNLYEIVVTIRNISEANVDNVRYRRILDWDIPPFPFNEWVHIHVPGGSSSFLRATNDGFQLADPQSSPGPDLAPGAPEVTLVPGSPDFFDGPADQGSLFDFTLGTIFVGGSKTLTLYYGAAASRAAALNVIRGVGASIFSLGIPKIASDNSGPSTSGPHAFIFGVTGIGGEAAVNRSPVANGDTKSTAEDTPLTFPASDLTANDTDPDFDTLTVTAVTATGNTHGTVGLMTGNVTYSPDTNFNGTASFNYTISDGFGGSATGTVTVTVTPVNDAPTAAAQSVSTAEDTAILISLSGSDVDNTSLGFSIVSAPTHGSLSVAIGAPSCVMVSNGTGTPGANCTAAVTYTPAANYFGPDSFTFNVRDGNLPSNTATVSITVAAVNDSPVLTVPGPMTVNEGAPISFTVSATDVDGPFPLTFAVSNLPAGATLTPSGTSATFTWTPSAAQGGPNPYLVQISVCDGQHCDTKVVNITVNDTIADRDGDGVMDAQDNCPDDPNANQADVCHNSPQPVAATQTVTRFDNQIPVTFTTTVSNDRTDISFLPPTLFTVNCQVINAAGSVVPISRIPEAGPFVLNLGEVNRPGDLVKIAARATATFSTTFDLRIYYPDLPDGKFTTSCTYVQFGDILNPTADDPPLWRGEIHAPPQTIFVGTYTFSGFLSPLPGAKFKQGNTVPVKFTLKDSTGAFVTNCTCTLTFQRLDGNGNPIGSPMPARSKSGDGNQFKYDTKSDQYHFNVDSGSLPVGPIQLQADLHDGSAIRTTNVVVTP